MNGSLRELFELAKHKTRYGDDFEMISQIKVCFHTRFLCMFIHVPSLKHYHSCNATHIHLSCVREYVCLWLMCVKRCRCTYVFVWSSYETDIGRIWLHCNNITLGSIRCFWIISVAFSISICSTFLQQSTICIEFDWRFFFCLSIQVLLNQNKNHQKPYPAKEAVVFEFGVNEKESNKKPKIWKILLKNGLWHSNSEVYSICFQLDLRGKYFPFEFKLYSKWFK